MGAGLAKASVPMADETNVHILYGRKQDLSEGLVHAVILIEEGGGCVLRIADVGNLWSRGMFRNYGFGSRFNGDNKNRGE